MNRLALLTAFTLTAPAVAGVVSRDLFEPGDGLLTYDDVNQREWLDFSVTAELFDPSNPTHVSLPAELGEFQLAALAEVEALMASVSIPEVEAWSVSGMASGPANLIELMGETGRFSGSVLGDSAYAGGYVSTGTEGLISPHDTIAVLAFNFGIGRLPGALGGPRETVRSHGYYRLTIENYPFAFGPIDQRDFNVFYDRAQGAPAYWLYRDAAAVPEPAAGWLALAACLGALRLRALA